MTERAPAFQFYPKDYTNDEHVQLMTLEQEGAYLRLLCHSWLNGSIPADRPAQARICRVPTGKMARLWHGIAPCWTEVVGGRLVNRRQERDRAKQEIFRQGRSEAGKASGAVRRTRVQRVFEQNANTQPTDSSGSVQTKSNSPSPSAVSVLRTPVERTNERSGERSGQRANPFVAGNREALELESLRLCREIGELRKSRLNGAPEKPDEPIDGAEIFTRAAHYEGALRQKCNPATMGDDRLLLTVQDLRATAQVEREKAAKRSA